MSTLVLNADYRPMEYYPLSTMDWRDAVKACLSGKFTIVHSYEDWVVNSPSISMAVPSVIVSKEYYHLDKLFGRVTLRKENIFLRDMYRCQYCGEFFGLSELTIDHVHPRSRGGKHEWTNVVTACNSCNQAKGNRLGITPLRKPFEPTVFHLSACRIQRKGTILHPSWEQYLGLKELGLNT